MEEKDNETYLQYRSWAYDGGKPGGMWLIIRFRIFRQCNGCRSGSGR